MAQAHETRIPLHCQCCGREVLAELVITPKGRKVVIIAQRHGRKHCVALALSHENMSGYHRLLDNVRKAV